MNIYKKTIRENSCAGKKEFWILGFIQKKIFYTKLQFYMNLYKIV